MVNNGSKNDSQLVVNDLVPKYKFARTVRVEVNQSYGFGIISGLKEAKGEHIGWTHLDMHTNPDDSLIALEIIERKGRLNEIFFKAKYFI